MVTTISVSRMQSYHFVNCQLANATDKVITCFITFVIKYFDDMQLQCLSPAFTK